MLFGENVENHHESNADNGGLACEVSEGRKNTNRAIFVKLCVKNLCLLAH